MTPRTDIASAGTRRLRTHRVAILSALGAFALLLTTNAADATLTTGACLVQKRMAWITLRKCQGGEQVKQLKGKPADLAKCDAKFQEKVAKIADKATKAAIVCRYHDNGDSSVTDLDTGLMWAKNNDVTVGYKASWSAVMSDFVSACNGTSIDGIALALGCSFYHDWHVPNVLELETILDPSIPGCGIGTPCIDPIFGPSAAGNHWSSSRLASNGVYAWDVGFYDGFIVNDLESATLYVRAVRAGL